MESEKTAPITKETVLEKITTPQLGPVLINIPEGQALCRDGVAFTVITIDHKEAGKLIALISCGEANGSLYGIINGMTPDETRSLAASMISAANDLDGGQKGLN